MRPYIAFIRMPLLLLSVTAFLLAQPGQASASLLTKTSCCTNPQSVEATHGTAIVITDSTNQPQPSAKTAIPGKQSGIQSMTSSSGKSNKDDPSQSPMYARRMLIEDMALVTGIPWYQLAAVDQYERTRSQTHPKKYPKRDGLIAIQFSEIQWSGLFNPDQADHQPETIELFGGIGQDGDGDGKAERSNDADVLYTMARLLLDSGMSKEDFPAAVWNYYQNDRIARRINQFARIYQHFGSIDLSRHAFPVPITSQYSYRSTWGAARGWGGRRIHEGTDIFAGYGVPVRSTTYGVIEIMGWNRYGGWRVGIRDINNIYHYYAHLSGFNKQYKAGDIVQPGEVIGWVGSSGYGKPGTSGKFPPHLHYGLYRDNGYSDWSFDPYPMLKRWERAEYKARRKAK
ncbi:M23 family metallopeptidase [Marinicrinis sediminis]|uniref:M23 family metallopeptidase n=1 Tax=Marinicrinis sediminis TaxID=1652465 RepID=A0ABW5R7P7_9BACL